MKQRVQLATKHFAPSHYNLQERDATMSEGIMKSPRVEMALKQAVFDTVKLRETYPGYPSIRLTAENSDIAQQLSRGRISVLPEGPWDAGYDNLKPQTQEQLDLIRLQGYDFDDAGRPLHPWLTDMLTDANVGVVTGTGKYWYLGPNKTADPVVITNEPTPMYSSCLGMITTSGL